MCPASAWRPVDYNLRRDLLDRLKQLDSGKAGTRRDLAHRESIVGGGRLFVTAQTLRFRRFHAALFQSAHYTPLEADGPDAQHLYG